MARTKTASRVRSQSPPNAANDQPSDHSPLNETPLHTTSQDEIILPLNLQNHRNLRLLKGQPEDLKG